MARAIPNEIHLLECHAQGVGVHANAELFIELGQQLTCTQCLLRRPQAQLLSLRWAYLRGRATSVLVRQRRKPLCQPMLAPVIDCVKAQALQLGNFFCPQPMGKMQQV